MDRFMRDSDAFAWYMEQDPTLRSTIVAVAWLERSPDWDRLVAKIDGATQRVPIFRQRVVEPPARIATPRWIVDDQFDLAWHVRRIDSPAPHTPETVVEFARNAAMTAFDHARPLWEFTLVEHLEGGRAALVMKVHHALTDGIGGMDLALELFDRDADAAGDLAAETPPAVGAAPAPSSVWSLVRDSVVHDCERVVGFVGGTAGSALPLAWRTARHPVAAFDEVLETVRSLARTVAPVNETRSPIMKRRSMGRHFDMLEVGVDDLKRAAAAADGSLNDAFMAAVSGGLCRYHDLHGAAVGDLRVTLPISIRTPDDPPGGNRITLIRFSVPVADPAAERIRAMSRLCRAARDERSLRFTGAIAGTLNLLPRAIIGAMLKHVDFLASDIPGFTFPVHLAGARVDGYVAFAPTVGTSVNFALLSYNGTCCVGVSIDTAAVAAPDLLVECVREGFEEVLALGGAHAPVRRPLAEHAGEVEVDEVVLPA